MNPESNKFEKLRYFSDNEVQRQIEATRDEYQQALGDSLISEDALNNASGKLFRPNGEVVPKHWSIFTVGENVVIKDYTFRVAYIGEGNILFEPVGPVLLEKKDK